MPRDHLLGADRESPVWIKALNGARTVLMGIVTHKREREAIPAFSSAYHAGSCRFGYTVAEVLTLLFLCIPVAGCVSGDTKDESDVSLYQKALVDKGPQKRTGSEGLDALRPAADPRMPPLEVSEDAAGKKTVTLTLAHALSRALANSPEISVVSFDPTIAKEKVVVEAAKFDFTAFGNLEVNDKDAPSNNVSETGVSRSNLWEVGVKQKGITGAEWRISYAMIHTIDDSVSRVFPRSYEPSLAFMVKQPLLRNAWQDVNLSAVKTAKLQYQTALADFRRQAEDVLTQVISLYWALLQSRRDVEIYRDFLDKAVQTLTKVEDRKGIDATTGDIMQVKATVKRREADLLRAQKIHTDVRESLVRLLADSQLNILNNLDIVPMTAPEISAKELIPSELLELALKNNAEIVRAHIEVEVAEINMNVAKKQQLPSLDLVASARLDGLSDDQGYASRMISDRDHASYFLGLSFEYPFSNREKTAEFRQRELQYAKASSKLQALQDQTALLIKERIRAAETAQREIQIYKDAVSADRIHLQVIEDIGVVRKRLTPEFLLTVIQAQESLADSQRAEIKAVADYNIALSRLSQAAGTLMNLEPIKQGMQNIIVVEQ